MCDSLNGASRSRLHKSLVGFRRLGLHRLVKIQLLKVHSRFPTLRGVLSVSSKLSLQRSLELS